MRREELLTHTSPAADTIAAWLPTFSAAARRNGASAQAPGDIFRWPHTVIPTRPPGRRTRYISATAPGVVPQIPRELGDDVERRWVPRQGVHVADPDVAVRVPVPGHRDQPGRGVDTGAGSAAQASQFDGEPGPASDVEQPVTGIDAEPMVHSDVLPAVSRLAEGREIHRLAAPALVHQRPRGRVCARPRHSRSSASPGLPLRCRRSAGPAGERAGAGWHRWHGGPGRRGRPGSGRTDRRTGGGPSLRSVIVPRQAWEGLPRAEGRICARVAPGLLWNRSRASTRRSRPGFSWRDA